jgi:hypothetical protein
MTWDLFLAHASADKPRVRPLVAALRALGLRVFLDEDSIPLGAEWDLFIPKAQRESRATVVCISAAYVAAFYERSEVHFGIALKRRGAHAVLPIYLDGRPGPDDVLYGLNLLQGLVLPDLGIAETARRIAEALAALPPAPASGAPATAAPPPPVSPATLFEALARLAASSFGELIFRSGLPASSLLPDTVDQTRRAINLIERASEAPGGYEALVATLRGMRPGIV